MLPIKETTMGITEEDMFEQQVESFVDDIINDSQKKADISISNKDSESTLSFQGTLTGLVESIGQLLYSICEETDFDVEVAAAAACEYALGLKKEEAENSNDENATALVVKKSETEPLPDNIDPSLWD